MTNLSNKQRAVTSSDTKSYRFRDLKDGSFGKWTVVGPSRGVVSKLGYRHTQWWCACVCGARRWVNASHLVGGRSTCCGCVGDRYTGERSTRHGGSRKPEYVIWVSMIQRCKNPRNSHYRYYGARGIRVCRRWLDFAKFFSDMGPRPSASHSIERRNNNRGYTPANCCWATRSQQDKNKSSSIRLTLNGKTLGLKEWSKHLGMGYSTLRLRVARGWSARKTLTTPIRNHRPYRPRSTT